ncbi:MAG: hypothetical protein ABI353_06045 [Isosphaeraceae bacterium]
MFTGKSNPPEAEQANPFSFLQTEQPAPLRTEPTHRRLKPAEPAAPSPAPPPPQADEPTQRHEPHKSARSKPASSRPAKPAPPPTPKVEVQTPVFVPAPSPPPVEEPVFPSIQIEPQPLRDEPAPLLPPVQVEPSPTLSQREPPPRRNDVVLPRTAVILWSFLVLMTMVLAFSTGLLTGHFLWKSTMPAAVQAREPAPMVPDQP